MRVHRVQVKTVTKHSMKASGGTEIWPHTFLTTALDKNKWSYSRPGHLSPDTHLVPEPVRTLRRRDFLALLISEKKPVGQAACRVITYAN